MRFVHSTVRALRCLTVVSIAAVALTGCAAQATAPAAESLADLGHVHGLGVDPATGDTFVATHRGVWRLDSAYLGDKSEATKPEQIAGLSQDTMGFTIAGPDLMFASGHPDPANNPDQSPPNLGLIESRDSAASWKTVSLGGETDFHDLVTAPLNGDGSQLRIYGYDAGRQTVRVSDDSGATWEDGASIALRKLAVNKSHPDTVYATTQSGLQVSQDGGGSFSIVSGSPTLFLIDARNETPGSFIGVDINNAIWSTDDGALTWQRHGTLTSPPEAMAYASAAGKQWILATDSRGIVASADLGETWTILIPGESR